MIARIKELLESAGNLYANDHKTCLPRMYFANHLYQPLLKELHAQGAQISPPPMNEGETHFMECLRDYAQGEFVAGVKEIYALRNHPKIGVGFCLADAVMHYPDFILWVVGEHRNRIVFVEPHGMQMANVYENEHKARLWELMRDMPKKHFPNHPPLEMDSYLVSVTSYEIMRKKWDDAWNKDKFNENHIIFAEDLQNKTARASAFAQMFGFKDGGKHTTKKMPTTNRRI